MRLYIRLLTNSCMEYLSTILSQTMSTLTDSLHLLEEHSANPNFIVTLHIPYFLEPHLIPLQSLRCPSVENWGVVIFVPAYSTACTVQLHHASMISKHLVGIIVILLMYRYICIHSDMCITFHTWASTVQTH